MHKSVRLSTLHVKSHAFRSRRDGEVQIASRGSRALLSREEVG